MKTVFNFKHHKIWLFTLLIALNLAFFGLTTPSRVPSLALIAGFGLIVLNMYVVVWALLRGLRWYGISFGIHSRKIALGLTGVVGGLTALQSIGQLTVRDVAVLLPFAAIAYFYSSLRQKI